MCRRIITHYMHHDVAYPMLLTTTHPTNIHHANPLRTPHHVCELIRPPYLNTNIPHCPYHTCCIPSDKIVPCADYNDDEDEPEQCPTFILEHHHHYLPYFGLDPSESYREPYRRPVPATWRYLRRLRDEVSDEAGDAWFPCYARDPRLRARWEEDFFAACEAFCVLVGDVEAVYAAVEDMRNLRVEEELVERGERDLRVLMARMKAQADVVERLRRWASEGDGVDSGMM